MRLTPTSSPFFDGALVAYALSAVAGTVGAIWKWRPSRIFGAVSLAAGLACQTVFIVARWLTAGRPPFSDTFETMVLFAASTVFVYLLLCAFYRTTVLSGAVGLLALLVSAYATLFESDIRPLMPALQDSFWLTTHVLLCFVGYAGFAMSFLFGAAYAIRKGGRHAAVMLLLISFMTSGLAAILLKERLLSFNETHFLGPSAASRVKAVMIVGECLGAGLLIWVGLNIAGNILGRLRPQVPEAAGDDFPLEAFVYKSIAFGFPFLGLGILTGAVWANQAWGRYWGWDPKETWSLITWLIYATYLHLRFVKKWRGARLIWVAVAGFLAVLFTYFGVNYVLSGLHSYA